MCELISNNTVDTKENHSLTAYVCSGVGTVAAEIYKVCIGYGRETSERTLHEEISRAHYF